MGSTSDLALNLLGGGMIRLSQHVSLMPQTMLLSVGRKGTIEIGEHSEIGMYSRIASMGSVRIGKYVLTGPNVLIEDHNHEFKNPLIPIIRQGVRFIPKMDGSPNLLIEDGTWIGTNVAIVGNVHIGKNCVIGANSVVIKDIPDYSVAVGAPCKVIKRYDFNERKWVKMNF